MGLPENKICAAIRLKWGNYERNVVFLRFSASGGHKCTFFSLRRRLKMCRMPATACAVGPCSAAAR